jgi:hypothetical protein
MLSSLFVLMQIERDLGGAVPRQAAEVGVIHLQN